jgi:hypothetical protein
MANYRKHSGSGLGRQSVSSPSVVQTVEEIRGRDEYPVWRTPNQYANKPLLIAKNTTT